MIRTAPPGGNLMPTLNNIAPSLVILLADASCQTHYRSDTLDEADRQRCRRVPELEARPDWQSSRFLKHQCAAERARAHPWSMSHSQGHAALALLLPSGAFPGAQPGQGEERVAAKDPPALETAWPEQADNPADSIRIGVDLERIKPRAFAEHLPLFATQNEVAWWARQPDPAIAFYQLWTLKEALIKAEHPQHTPSLRNVGLFAEAMRATRQGTGIRKRRPTRKSPGSTPLEAASDLSPARAALPGSPGHNESPAAGAADNNKLSVQLRSPSGQIWQGLSAVLSGQWLLSCVWSAQDTPPDIHWQPFGQSWQIDSAWLFHAPDR